MTPWTISRDEHVYFREANYPSSRLVASQPNHLDGPGDGGVSVRVQFPKMLKHGSGFARWRRSSHYVEDRVPPTDVSFYNLPESQFSSGSGFGLLCLNLYCSLQLRISQLVCSHS